MYDALHAARLAKQFTEPLPQPESHAALRRLGFTAKRGQVCLIAGLPSAGKSMFALDWVAEMGLETIYFSADSDSLTMVSRLLANRLDHWTNQIESDLDLGRNLERYEEVLRESKIRFCFSSSPTFKRMEEELNAYIELFNRYPEVVVVDNLMDVDHRAGDNEYGDLRAALGELRGIAHDTGIAFFVLHHMNESEVPKTFKAGEPEPGTRPLPRTALAGKVSQRPEVVLSVASEGYDFFVSVVKNRGGEESRNASVYATLTRNPGKSKILQKRMHHG